MATKTIVDEKLHAALASPVCTSDESARRERIADLAEEAAFREAEATLACRPRQRSPMTIIIKAIHDINGDEQPGDLSEHPCAE